MEVLAPGHVFFDYGPVSMVVSAMRGGVGDTDLCRSAFEIIDGCLKQMRPVLEVLRSYPESVDPDALCGLPAVMARAVAATGDQLLTPMAAVAGSVSDAVADHLAAHGAEKAVANNGGDIAVRLADGQNLKLGVVYDLAAGTVSRTVCLTNRSGVGGVAASGVTVFSARCAEADALATLLADRSCLDLPAVHTVLAGELDSDSDIADQQVVVGVDPLTEAEKEQALDQVMKEAKLQFGKGNLLACIATVQGRTAVFDPNRILEES